MGTLQVQVAPINSGNVNVRVWMAQYPPTGTPIDQTFTATTQSPVNQSFQLDPGLYAVTISWSSGYQNVASGLAGNAIVVNGQGLYYQVLGNPADANGVSANFGVQI